MTVIDDFVAETLRLQGILGLLTQAQWQAESGADGWSVADVVLHLAQSDEAVAASADGADHRQDVAAAGTVDGWAARMGWRPSGPRPTWSSRDGERRATPPWKRSGRPTRGCRCRGWADR